MTRKRTPTGLHLCGNNNNNRPKITSLLVLLVTFMRYVGNNNISFDVVFKYGHNDVLFIHNKVKLKEINGETQR